MYSRETAGIFPECDTNFNGGFFFSALFKSNCFQTVHVYDFAGGLPVHTMFDDHDLVCESFLSETLTTKLCF